MLIACFQSLDTLRSEQNRKSRAYRYTAELRVNIAFRLPIRAAPPWDA
jgi:hypothetical protein